MADIRNQKYYSFVKRSGVNPSFPNVADNPADRENPVQPVLPLESIGIGITLNSQVIGGVKRRIETNDILNVPEYWEYNVTQLEVDGIIELDGEINLI